MMKATYNFYLNGYKGTVIQDANDYSKSLAIAKSHFKVVCDDVSKLQRYYCRVAEIIYYYNKNNTSDIPVWKDNQTQILVRNARILYLGKAEM